MPAVGSSRVTGAGPPAKHLTPGEQSLCRKVQIMHRNVTAFLNSQRKSLREDRCLVDKVSMVLLLPVICGSLFLIIQI